MAGILSAEPGGIFRLLDLPWEHWEAIEADLIKAGLSLDDIPNRLHWRAFMAMVKHAPEDSAIRQLRRREQGKQPPTGQVEQGEHADWPEDRHISVMILDQLRVMNYYTAATNAARAKRRAPDVPEPTHRPGMPISVDADGFTRNADGTTHVGTAMPKAEFRRWWLATEEERQNWKG